MMDKKLKGFSLAELLVSLLIISLVLSAAIPTLTKRSGANREYIWRWSSDGNNNAYFGNGKNQSAIIGHDKMPLKDTAVTDLINNFSDVTDKVDLGKIQFTTNGDKLVLLKRIPDLLESDFSNSHISLYTIAHNNSTKVEYAGRIVADPNNIAFGIGSLQSKRETEANTAIGHFSLVRDTEGEYNTALGYKTLSFNLSGSRNTAVGYKSLYSLDNQSKDSQGNKDNRPNSYNTALGTEALLHLQTGNKNIAIGSDAMSFLTQGDDNISIGYKSLKSLNADKSNKGNIAIGSEACGLHQSGDYNICIGNRAGINDFDMGKKGYKDSYELYIGSIGDSDIPVPLIEGHTQKTSTNDKELIVNAKQFSIRPYAGGTNIFQVNARSNGGTPDGYGNGKTGYTGEVYMHFRGDSGIANTNSGISLSFTGLARDGKNYAVIGSMDYNKIKAGNKNKDEALVNLSFNDFLDFTFPQKTAKAESDYTVSMTTSKKDYSLDLNGQIKMSNKGTPPTIKLDENNGFLYERSKDGKSTSFQISDNYVSLKNSTGSFLADLSSKSDYLLSLDKSKKAFMLTIGTDSINFGNGQAYFSAVNKKNISGNIGYNLKLNGQLQDDLKSIVDGMAAIYKNLSDRMTPSDARLKNISGDSKAGLKEINALEVKNFTYKKDKDKTPHVGVIAQQLIKIFPNSVFKDKDGYYKITTDEIFYAMVNSIKELCTQIQDLTAKITGLDKRITELEKQNQILKQQNAEFEKRLSKLEKASK